MKKLIGIAAFLAILYFTLLGADPNAASAANHKNLGQRIGKYGVLGLGAALLSVTGGIDLSIGAVVGLCATVAAMMLNGYLPGLVSRQIEVLPDGTPLETLIPNPQPIWLMIPAVLALGALIGWVHGMFVTRLKLQPFVVTLCGLFIYRGLARWLAGDASQGDVQNKPGYQALKGLLYRDDLWVLPKFFVIFLALLVVATVFLHFSVYGRYFFAIGSNETAARYSGIATDRYKIMAFVLCSMLAAFGGLMYLVEFDSVVPSEAGNFFELYAIAAAVVGGFSLRGGEGTAPGLLIGTAILWLLPNLVNMWGVKSELNDTVIGGALLIGALIDELLRRRLRA
jgi:ribose transport system permease protein